MRAAEQLAKALANSTKRYGFFLGRSVVAFRGLRGRSGRLVGLLTAASARMEQESPGDCLELHICTAATVEQYNEVCMRVRTQMKPVHGLHTVFFIVTQL